MIAITKMWPNKPHAANPAIALLDGIGRHRRGVADAERYPEIAYAQR